MIVCQGVKRGYLGGQVCQYDAQHYLAVSVPVPFTMETEATAEPPLLAIYLHLDLQLAADLLIELGERAASAGVPAQSVMSSPMQGASWRPRCCACWERWLIRLEAERVGPLAGTRAVFPGADRCTGWGQCARRWPCAGASAASAKCCGMSMGPIRRRWMLRRCRAGGDERGHGYHDPL